MPCKESNLNGWSFHSASNGCLTNHSLAEPTEGAPTPVALAALAPMVQVRGAALPFLQGAIETICAVLVLVAFLPHAQMFVSEALDAQRVHAHIVVDAAMLVVLTVVAGSAEAKPAGAKVAAHALTKSREPSFDMCLLAIHAGPH